MVPWREIGQRDTQRERGEVGRESDQSEIFRMNWMEDCRTPPIYREREYDQI